MTKKSGIVIKTIGIGVTVLGILLDIVDDWVSDKEMEEKIQEKVDEALAKRKNEED